MTDAAPASKRRIPAKGVVAGLLSIVILVFILQNRQEATLTFFATDKRFPVWIVLAVTAAIGGVIGQLIERIIRKEHKE